jgi:transcriptional regulator with XRE-family HTH domain
MPNTELERWRQIIDRLSAKEKKQLAETVGVTYTTVTRWASGESSPKQAQMIRRLAKLEVQGLEEAVREREEFSYAFEFPDEDNDLQVPVSWLIEVLSRRASTANFLRLYAIHKYVYRNALELLDPREEGMMMLFIECAAPQNEKVTELLVHRGRGTGPSWGLKQIEHEFSLGRDTLCGLAISTGHATFYQEVAAPELRLPIVDAGLVQSIGVFPMLLSGEFVGGALFVASVRPDFFTVPRRAFLETCANMMALGITEEQFYAHDRIELAVLLA